MKTKIGTLLAVTLATTMPALASPKGQPVAKPRPARRRHDDDRGAARAYGIVLDPRRIAALTA